MLKRKELQILYITKLDYILFKKYYINKIIYNLPKAGLIIKAISSPINYIMLCCMIRKPVKTMLFFYEIACNYGHFHSIISTKTLDKNDLK